MPPKKSLIKSDLVNKAQKKLSLKRPFALCKYLPNDQGFQMHHFVMQKLQRQNPKEFETLLRKYILDAKNPKKLPAQPRAPRAKSTTPKLKLNQSDLGALIRLAQASGNEGLVQKLQTTLPLAQIKRDLIQAIKKEEIDLNLWNTFVDAINAKQKVVSK